MIAVDLTAGDPMPTDPIEDLTLALRTFTRERDWQQFHTPKNLAIGVMIEAAEIAELFQWSDGAAGANMSDTARREIALEIGDTLLYLLLLADALGIDPIAAARDKMKINAERYPIEKAFGKSAKYDKL